MTKTVIIDALRTPIGKFGGTLKDIPAPELAAIPIRELVSRNGLKSEMIDGVIMGIVVNAGVGQIPSRQAAIRAGLDPSVPSETINKVCASGFRSATLADTIIRAGDGHLFIAGGMENMSAAPYLSFDARWGYRMGEGKLVDAMIQDGLWCAFEDVHMAIHGNTIAKEYDLSREEQDKFACQSQNRAEEAIKAGRLKDEIVPVKIPQKRGDPLVFDTDEFPRFGTTVDSLSKLPPIFVKDGTVTAGNAPGVNDAGAAMIVASEETAKEMGKRPLARIIAHSHVAMKPYQFPIAPAYAAKKLLEKAGKKISDIDLMEFNEAFAAVALACGKILEWDPSKVNVNGGAIALGHPIGMSGSRIIMTLAYELKRRGGGLGMAAICSGSGQGDAILIEVEA